MLHTLKPFHCPSCNNAFCSRDTSRHHSPSKFPFILPCSHSVCESCLHVAVKSRSNFSCPLCKFQVDLSEGNNAIAKLHPDLHILGVLNANRKPFSSIKIKMLPSSEMMKNLSSNSLSKSAVILCETCRDVEALWQCDECQLNFCSLCFDKVHKNIKSKKRHEVRRIFAELYNTMVQEGCKEHKNKSVEFYCEKDDTLTCSHCMLVGDHIGHEVKSLVDKNKSCSEDLKNVLQDISGIEKRLRYTEHLLNDVSFGEKIDISEYIKQARDSFHKLHAILQLRENQLISKLEEAANLQNEPFAKMMLEISGYQKDIASMKRDAESVIENPCLAVSAPYLLKKLESFKSIPCYLLPIQNNEDKNFKIEMELSKEIENVLEKFGSVEYSIKPRFHLVPTGELPENYCMDIPEKFCLSDIDSQSTTTLDNFSEDSLMSSSSKSDIQAAFKYREFTRMQPEKVIVSHIKDPSCFWIQRCADMRKLHSISDAMNKWCKSHEAQRNKPPYVEKGDLYLARFSVDKKWYRGRVKRILETGETYELPSVGMKSCVVSKEKRIVKKDEVKIEVFYIDYGNSEVVSLSSLQNIQARFLNLAGLAKLCSLVDIAPVDQEWSLESIKSFTKFVNMKPVIMQVHEERNNVLMVDLSQVADNGISNDVPVSVRDALVFQELAVFPAGRITSTRKNKSEQQFLPPERLRANSNISAIVSHVDSPSHLYVQQISTASYLSSIIFEINEYYNQETNTLLHSIHAPRVGMICAAQFSLDKQWYRAQVKSLPGGANVEVQYVDFGNSEVINHRYIRKLSDKFHKLNIQAIPCKLADVTYNQKTCWSAEAKEWLTNKVSKKQLTLKCLGFVPGENKSEAVLFYKEDQFEVCVNALMVQEGLAASCGPESSEVRKVVIPPPVPQQVKAQLERTLSDESGDEPILPPVKSTKAKPPSSTITKVFPESEGKHIEVHVSHVVNPSSFYVRIAGDIEKKLKELMKEMQKTYKDLEAKISEVCVGKAYAVYRETEKQWYRGTILSKGDKTVQVEFVDYGMKEDVPTKNIQKLMENFTSDEEFAIHCELTGIIPAGGSTQWSYAACDAFEALVATEETLHLTCKGEIDKDNKSLPVSLFIEEVIVGGALEPTKIVYVNVALELVNKGLALPIRKSSSKCASKSDCSDSEPSVKEKLSSGPKKCVSGCPEIKSPKKEEPEWIEQEVIIEPPKQLPPKFQWKPVAYPVEHTFKGFITNIGEDGSIHLHIHRDGSSAVELIKKSLQFKYSRSTYEKLLWAPPVGEACLAKFSVDNLWYRAEVLTIYPGKVKVNFVDYGNNEIVPLSDIRMDILMQNLPKQCLECVISGAYTGAPGEWDQDLLNFLHAQLVETIVDIEVMGAPNQEGKLPCNVVTSCGISVTELLDSMGFLDNSSEAFPEEYRTYQKATELREGDIFPVCITQINDDSPNIVYLQRIRIPVPKSDYEKEHNKEHEAFLELISELQDKAETFPLIKEPMPGVACCAKYSYDNNWYRCEITDLNEEGVVVLYVDYGNSETLSAENLRNPDSDFINFPVQIHFCKIHGMAPVDKEFDPEVKKFMVKKLLVSGQEIFAKVVVPGKISEIDLMVKNEEGQMQLVYDELVEMQLITLRKSQ